MNLTFPTSCQFPPDFTTWKGCLNERGICVPDWQSVLLKYTAYCSPCLCVENKVSYFCYRVDCRSLECSTKGNQSDCCPYCVGIFIPKIGIVGKKIPFDLGVLLFLLILLVAVYRYYRRNTDSINYAFREDFGVIDMVKHTGSNPFSSTIGELQIYKKDLHSSPPSYHQVIKVIQEIPSKSEPKKT